MPLHYLKEKDISIMVTYTAIDKPCTRDYGKLEHFCTALSLPAAFSSVDGGGSDLLPMGWSDGLPHR